MNTIYIRTLKRAEHTVFNVANGQSIITIHNSTDVFRFLVANK